MRQPIAIATVGREPGRGAREGTIGTDVSRVEHFGADEVYDPPGPQMIPSGRAWLVVAVAVLATAPQQQAPVFRASTNVVPLTVTVLDDKGQPVRDLKASDFVVTENGKVREIVNFFPQPLAPGPVAPPPVGGVYQQRSTNIAPATRRTFVIVLGLTAHGRTSGSCEPTYKSCEGAIEFVRTQLLPQDSVALMAFHRITPFTTES